jgi:type II secretory pathway pseudopilin PulG
MSMPKRLWVNAYTLLEVLVCIGIILVISGLVFPVLIQAKKSATQSVEISHLHNFGIAAALYREDYGVQPLGSPQLIPAYLSQDLAVSPLDATPEGFANLILDEVSSGNSQFYSLKTKYRRTYIGFYDFGWDARKWGECTSDESQVSWLISLTPANYDPRFSIANATGRYRRLMIDGSVQIGNVRHFDSPLGEAWWPVSFFVEIGEVERWNVAHPRCSLRF